MNLLTILGDQPLPAAWEKQVRVWEPLHGQQAQCQSELYTQHLLVSALAGEHCLNYLESIPGADKQDRHSKHKLVCESNSYSEGCFSFQP